MELQTPVMHLRSVDPRTLKPNPNNPRTAPVPPAQDEQLLASIRTRNIIQPPVVAEKDGDLVIRAGHRRVKMAIKLGLNPIIVIETEPGNIDPMDSLAENLIRASMTSVDTWRGIDNLEKQNPHWNEQAVADSLALPVRTVKRLKLLAHLHPPMLDVMAKGSMPTEEQLRTIAAATVEEQAQVWRKNKPRKGHEFYWHEIARALSKRRIPFSAAKFDDDLARAYGVVWEDDLFVPAGEDGRYTTNVEGFFGAQHEWLANNLPERGTLLAQDEYGRPVLPKKAEQVYSKPGKTDVIGHYLDPHTGEAKTIAYRVQADKSTAKPGKSRGATASEAPQPKSRPDVTQKGNAIVGDLRTAALHQALQDRDIDDGTLLALLVLALGGKNVSIQSAAEGGRYGREALACGLIEGGVLATDQDVVRKAARAMLQIALSCRDNMTNSGIVGRVAGDAIDANLFLPNMATEEFLTCLSKAAIEKAAAAEGVKIGSRGKDTRANLIAHFKDSTYVHPSALFSPSTEEIAEATRQANDWDESGGEDDACTGEGEGTGEDYEDGSDTGLGTDPGEDQLPAAAE
jgi:ParB family transcriptional regulator, chromosome partitioning protein